MTADRRLQAQVVAIAGAGDFAVATVADRTSTFIKFCGRKRLTQLDEARVFVTPVGVELLETRTLEERLGGLAPHLLPAGAFG